MNYLEKINNIISTLEKNNNLNAANKIKSLKDGACVSSELLMSVTHELLMFINREKHIKDLIGEDVLELKKYCWSIGLQVK